MLKNIEAAIFDLDGTLIDSMWVWEEIDIKYLKNRGLKMPKDLRDNIEHLSFDDTAKYFKSRFNLHESLDEIKNEWNDMALFEYSNNVRLKSGVRSFLELLKRRKIKIALATSNSRTLLEIALKNNDIHHYFDVICTTDQVTRGKNFPDIYLYTASKLGVKPDKCIVFEDILPAVLSARQAGMKVVGIYDEASIHQKNDIIRVVEKYISDYNELQVV